MSGRPSSFDSCLFFTPQFQIMFSGCLMRLLCSWNLGGLGVRLMLSKGSVRLAFFASRFGTTICLTSVIQPRTYFGVLQTTSGLIEVSSPYTAHPRPWTVSTSRTICMTRISVSTPSIRGREWAGSKLLLLYYTSYVC